MKIPGERLKSLRESIDLTQKMLAEKLGMEQHQVRDIELGKVVLSVPISKLLHYVVGVNSDWLLKGDGPMMSSEYPDSSQRHISPFIAESAVNFGDYVFVPQVSGEISAGRGLVPDNMVELKIAFRKEWIQRRGDPNKMSLIRVSGDSMEPTLRSGDLVLVDHEKNYIDPQGGIYAISIDQTIMIKRIQVIHPLKRLKVISDNVHYDPIDTTSDQLQINGRVIWFGREIDH